MNTSLTEHYGAVFARIRAASPGDEFGIDTVAEQVAVLKEAGFGTLRTRDDGHASLEVLLSLVRDLGTVDPSLAHIFRNHYFFIESFLARMASSDTQWIHAKIGDGALFSIANTEIGVTNNACAYRTKVVGKNGALSLSGKKYYTTGAWFSDYVAVRANDEAGATGTAVIPTGRAGVQLLGDWNGFGQRQTQSGGIEFDDVVVEAHEFIPDATLSAPVIYAGTIAQVYLTAIIAGIVGRAHEDAVRLLRGRRNPFYYIADKPANDALYLRTVGLLSSYDFAARASVVEVGRRMDHALHTNDREDGHAAALAAAQAKVVVDELGQQAASQLFNVLGASSTAASLNLDRHWRNIRTLASHNPADHKAAAIGNYSVNQIALPATGFF